MLLIPLSPIPAQRCSVILGGRNCVLSLYQRERTLYADLEVNGVPVAQGAACRNLADIVQSPARDFSGTLHFVDTTGDTDPVWEKLGSRYLLIYAEEGETDFTPRPQGGAYAKAEADYDG